MEAVGSGVVGPPLKLDEEKKMGEGGGGGGGREGGDLGRGEKRGEGSGSQGFWVFRRFKHFDSAVAHDKNKSRMFLLIF